MLPIVLNCTDEKALNSLRTVFLDGKNEHQKCSQKVNY